REGSALAALLCARRVVCRVCGRWADSGPRKYILHLAHYTALRPGCQICVRRCNRLYCPVEAWNQRTKEPRNQRTKEPKNQRTKNKRHVSRITYHDESDLYLSRWRWSGAGRRR